jgi:hypothetical protein
LQSVKITYVLSLYSERIKGLHVSANQLVIIRPTDKNIIGMRSQTSQFPFFVAQQPLLGQGLLLSSLHDHTQTHHIGLDLCGRVTSAMQGALPDNTQNSQETDVHAPAGIRSHNPSKRAAADPRLRKRSYWDRTIHRVKISVIWKVYHTATKKLVSGCLHQIISTQRRFKCLYTSKIFLHFTLNIIAYVFLFCAFWDLIPKIQL